MPKSDFPGSVTVRGSVVVDNTSVVPAAVVGVTSIYTDADGAVKAMPPSGVAVSLGGEGQLEADLAAITALKGATKIGVQDAALRITAVNAETALAELAARTLQASASETAIKAIPAAARADGTLIVDLTNNVLWQFDSGSAAGASGFVLVPDVGTGRWLRNQPSLADLSSVATGLGASLIGVDATNNTLEVALAAVKATADAAAVAATLSATTLGNGASDIGVHDAATLYTATDVEAALAEVKLLADAAIGIQKRTLTIGHADLTEAVAGTPMAINLGAALPANAIVFANAITAVTGFAGGAVSACKMDVGGTDVDGIVKQLELITDAPTEAEKAAAVGILPQGRYSSQQLVVTVTPDGGNALADLTSGAISFEVFFSVLA